jgi:hypothetical protein
MREMTRFEPCPAASLDPADSPIKRANHARGRLHPSSQSALGL